MALQASNIMFAVNHVMQLGIFLETHDLYNVSQQLTCFTPTKLSRKSKVERDLITLFMFALK